MQACSCLTGKPISLPALQAQRAAAGLPPERGLNASILTAVGGLLHEVLRPHLIIFAVFVTGSLWDWSCLISEPVAAGPAP